MRAEHDERLNRMSASDDTEMSDKDRLMKRLRPWHWVLTVVFSLIFLLSLPFAMRSLLVGPAEGVGQTMFMFMNLSVAAFPFTVLLTMVAGWMYHRGGAQKTGFGVYIIPFVNIAIIFLLRAGLQ